MPHSVHDDLFTMCPYHGTLQTTINTLTKAFYERAKQSINNCDPTAYLSLLRRCAAAISAVGDGDTNVTGETACTRGATAPVQRPAEHGQDVEHIRRAEERYTCEAGEDFC